MTLEPTSHLTSCRACGKGRLKSFINLGTTPLSNAMVPFDAADKGEVAYPLHAFVCEDCFLVQLGEFETPESIFMEDYVYFSSFSTSWLDHAQRYSRQMIERFDLSEEAHIAEVASNDGYLLQWFQKAGFKVTGIEPADVCAAAARKIGVETIGVFFGVETARAIAEQRGKADLIAANNVLAHVPDLADFVGGFRELLSADGVITFEFPHLLNLIEQTQFDTIYHEHFSYLSLRPVMEVLRNADLRVFDVEELSTHGGSLRVFACHQSARHAEDQRVDALLAKEEQAGIYDAATYDGFSQDVCAIKDDLLEFLIKARRHGKSVAAYGAAAKGSTLLNYCGVGPEHVRFVVDKNPMKQQRFMPGVRIPVHDVEHLVANMPDYVLILPWNLRTEIDQQLSEMRVSSKRVTAIPRLEISS